MSPGVGGNKETNATEVGSGVAGHQGISDASDHTGESNEGLSELTIRQKAVALQNGCLNVAVAREELRMHIQNNMGMEYGKLGVWNGSMGIEKDNCKTTTIVLSESD